MQLFVPDPYVGSHQAVAQLHAANATLEALNVIKQLQALNDHGGASTKFHCAVRTLFLAADAQHRFLWNSIVGVIVSIKVAPDRIRRQYECCFRFVLEKRA